MEVLKYVFGIAKED